MKNILCSHIELPSKSIGSWNIMFTRLLQEKNNLFDIVISPQSENNLDTIKQISVIDNLFYKKILSKYNYYYSYYNFWKKIKKIINNEDKVVVNIIDNINLLLAIDFFAKRKNVRSKLFIIFHLHGYNFDVDVNKRNKIYNAINKLILLTETSYYFQLQHNHTIPCEVEVLRNGIDTNMFYPLTFEEKLKLRIKLKLKENKIYFLWISQDRPKKGLFIILKAWEKIVENNKNVELLILGTFNEIKGKQITWLGRKPNSELASYYQATDYYLFSTLCHEGHPLSLTEALKCGAKCLASNIDPVSEILHDGNLGMLVDLPNFVSSWVNTIEFALKNDIDFNEEKLDLLKLYDFSQWSKEIKKIFDDYNS